MQATHLDAERRYELYRSESRQYAQAALPQKYKAVVSLKGIDPRSLARAKAWEASERREVDWNWTKGYEVYSLRYPKRFELAIWKDDILCGLSIGRPSYNGSRLRLDFTERAPDNCPLRGQVMQINLLAAESYALRIGADEMRIMHPSNQELVNYYARHGYKYVKGTMDFDDAHERNPHYLYKRL
ncbi:hypothetical protein [Microbulbifer sp. TRSA005]|uniref:hypothetical protein n=1 Tax=Microbulbifer sp. TRSA005 TaxID=3243383 RepID=UPI0040393E20